MHQINKHTILSVLTMVFVFGTAFAFAQGSGEKDLKLFFKQHCVKCHGADGSAHDEKGEKLKGEDFTDQEWQQDTSDEKMVKVIMKGIFFGLAMPSFKDELTKEEAEKLVTEIVRKSKKGKIIAPDTE